ncbi:MAG: OmpA family protein [Bdellovibrionaceae bacterium]|nr:OmpA family protein [Pseudobdellovibrionaceae bacterium]
MTQLLAFTVSTLLALTTQAHACNCGGKTVLKDVNSRESSIITSRDGTHLKANFFGSEEVAPAPVAVAPKKQTAPVAATVSSDIETPVKAFKLEFAPNAKTPTASSLEQVPEIKKMLASGNFKTVKIVGFADQTGSVAYNNKLSLTRAQEIQKMLKGTAPKKTALSAVGGGVKDTSNLDSARVVEVQFVK